MTEEILFEVYDCNPTDGKQFMGLAIVSVEELLVNPCQRQVLSLQARPYQDDLVSGTLTLEVSIISYIVICLRHSIVIITNDDL